jgi:leucyl-tRNA synthetase
MSAPDVVWAEGDRALRQVTHRFLADAPGMMEAFKFNVVIARLMDLVNVTRKAIDNGPGAGDPAVREAVETITLGLSVFAPYTGEEMWEKLGYEATVATYGWRKADPTLLVQETLTAVVQVNGKVRDSFEVSKSIDPAELESMARASANVQRYIGDREIVKVIVRAPKLVNIAIKG